MDSLSIGSVVKVGVNEYSPVLLFTHQLSSSKRNFIQLETASGAKLSLTEGHYIYTSVGLVAASDVSVGDLLILGDGRRTEVESIRSASKLGLYNPQTEHGDILVNNILAACYTTAVEPSIAHAVLAPLRVSSSLRVLYEFSISTTQYFLNMAPTSLIVS